MYVSRPYIMLMVSIKILHSYSFFGCLCRFSFSHSVPFQWQVGRTAEEASARMKAMKGAVLSGLDTLEVAEKKVLMFSLGVELKWNGTKVLS